ncbi:hypothetical protein [Acidisphaera rubrifaciens]|uniref:Uncharacterized protein n=1 Tax=Acidisphaera rubrifaciens HS-AP3 TaxID=1231350 RepID=A0A0D6P4K4_9PROT|nr:hypothetical protein [Acidisphaera rubrifaciens]GAN76271.1 hypothetical protein Asru_0081_07 [Acidisphaera rubrifaciens HS-AP3]
MPIHNRHQHRAQAAQARIGCTPDDLARAVAVAEQAGQPGLAELLRAVRQGKIQLTHVPHRDAEVTARDLPQTGAAVVLVGDDDYSSTGPAGWRCAATIAAWAEAAVVHAAGATAETYAEAVHAARLLGRCVLIETDAAHAREWAERFPLKPTLVIVPRDGEHPTRPAAEVVQ